MSCPVTLQGRVDLLEERMSALLLLVQKLAENQKKIADDTARALESLRQQVSLNNQPERNVCSKN